jgi:hypothetical protein
MVIPMQERNAMPPPIRCALGAGLLALCGLLAACAGSPERPAPDAQSAPVLERVVMLMRHGVRPPTKPQVAPEGMADREWPTWSTGFGELTQHGYDAVRLVGAWDRTHWAARGLIPTDGCPSQDTVAVAASAKSRTQDTARALLEGLAPGCGIAVAFPAGADEDFEFHPLETGYTRDDPPPGGALGFEVLSDARGERFVRAFYRSQTMDQVRELQPLSDANAPAYVSLPIPGCAQPCRLDDYAALGRGKLVAPVAAAAR